MKSDLMHRRVQVEPTILKNLVTEVRETVATDVEMSEARKSSFGILNLWDIRRNRRYAAHNTRKQPRIVTGFGY
jgi:hypothetical protein